MKKLISVKVAGMVILVLLSGLLLLHVFILAGIISFDLVWGGNIEYKYEMIRLEIVALITTILFMIVTIYKLKFLKQKKNSKLINIGAWIMFSYFTLNVVGNILAKTGAERQIFIPISILLSVFSFRMALKK